LELEQILILVIIVVTLIIILGSIFNTRRKRSNVKSLLDEIDDASSRYKNNARRCEAELYRYKDMVLEEYKSGKITEDAYNVLNKRIDEQRRRGMEYRREGEIITGSGVVEAPNPMKPLTTYPVPVHVVGKELPKGVKVEEGRFRETIGLEMKVRGPPIVILGYGEAFDVSPRRHEVNVPRRGERSTVVFHVTPKASALKTERLFFEFSQGDNFLGVANTTLDISTAGLTRKVVVTVSFPLRLHV
jgi:hypothetical protein